jgi:membrane protease YdiL (CAAX protease family)
MRPWIAKHPVMSCYLLAIIISWGYWFTLIAQGKTVAPGSSVSHLPGLLGPALAAIMVTTYLEGIAGLKDLFSRIVRWRSAWPRGILLALSPIPVAVLVFLILHLSGQALPSLHDFQSFPGVPGGLPFWLFLLVVLVSNGYGEEVGWRGYMMEKWLPRYGKFGTTLCVTALWLVWHVPVFCLNQSMAALVGPMLLGWAFGLACGAFVLAYLYLLSGRSILVLALWHMTYNMVVATPPAAGFPAAIISTAVMIWGGVIAWKWWREEHARPASR